MLANKSKLCLDAITRNDLETLRQLSSTPGGLLNDDIRRKSWLALLHIHQNEKEERVNDNIIITSPHSKFPHIPPSPIDENDVDYLEKIQMEILLGKSNGKSKKPIFNQSPDSSLGPIPDTPYNLQVKLDVDRSFVNHPNRELLKPRLEWLILHVLDRNPYLHYFQGFHDLSSVILLVYGPTRNAVRVTETLCQFWWRDFMHSTLDASLRHLHLLYPLINLMDPELMKFIVEVNRNVMSDGTDALLIYGTQEPRALEPFFCISWILTWCSHDISNWENLKRLFDFFISHCPLLPIYFTAQAICCQREVILKANQNDPSSIHKMLLNFPNDLPLEYLIRKTRETWSTIEPLYLLRQTQKLEWEALKDGKSLKIPVERHLLDDTSCAHPHRFLQHVLSINPNDPLDAQLAYEWFLKSPKGGLKRDNDFLERYRLLDVGKVVKWGVVGMVIVGLASLMLGP